MAFNEGYVDKNSNGVIESGEVGVGHASGYGVDPDGLSGSKTASQKIRFFTTLANDNTPTNNSKFIDAASALTDDLSTPNIDESIPDRYNNMTAKNFTVSADIMGDLNAIATSNNPNQVGHITVLNELIALRHSNTMFSEGAPEDFVKSIISSIAIDSQHAKKFTANQDLIVEHVENNRISVSGVSVDEEMANMVKFQHAYNAAAKMVSTMSEIYDQLINRVGVS